MSVDSNTSLDPRIQIELEKLNTATDNINKFEVELDLLKKKYESLELEGVENIKKSSLKISNAIEASEVYYKNRSLNIQLQRDVQLAAANYERAKTHLSAAKEMVYLAETGIGEKFILDTACQEMLSHATQRVNECINEVHEVSNHYKICQLKLEVARTKVEKLQRQLKGAIKISRPYFETRANQNMILKCHKLKMAELEAEVANNKTTYNEALSNLEEISESIHKAREEHLSRIQLQTIPTHPPPLQSKQNTPSKTAQVDDKENSINESSNINAYLRYENTDFEIEHTTRTDDIGEELWSEIRLSESNSESSSSYSDTNAPGEDDKSPNDDNHATSKPINISGISDWLTSSSLKSSGRRQSFDNIILDTGDRVKDVFSFSFQKIGIGKSLERRNSESEVCQTESSSSKEFSIFNRNDKNAELLSDEQVENLMLD